LVGINGQNFLLEIKDGSKPSSKQNLTPEQQTFHANWKGELRVVNSVKEALAFLEEKVAI
jgi:hypothetical protein